MAPYVRPLPVLPTLGTPLQARGDGYVPAQCMQLGCLVTDTVFNIANNADETPFQVVKTKKRLQIYNWVWSAAGGKSFATILSQNCNAFEMSYMNGYCSNHSHVLIQPCTSQGCNSTVYYRQHVVWLPGGG